VLVDEHDVDLLPFARGADPGEPAPDDDARTRGCLPTRCHPWSIPDRIAAAKTEHRSSPRMKETAASWDDAAGCRTIAG
jgi:hypothetical protein